MDMFSPDPNRVRVPLETSRLKLPPVVPREGVTPLKLLGSQAAATEEADRGTADPLIRGLVDRLPKPNAVWPLEERTKWLRTAASVFGLIYKDEDVEQRQIAIVLTKQAVSFTSGVARAQDAKTEPKTEPKAELKAEPKTESKTESEERLAAG
jgi:hypothetical protein